jgi:16S rRNA processing protein RimM
MTGLLEVGRIVNTHGVNGAVKIEPWTNSPEDFSLIPALTIRERTYRVLSASVRKSLVLVTLEGVDALDAAIALKNSIVSAARGDIPLPEGERFIVDLIGLEARDSETGGVFGTVRGVLPLPAHNVYEIEGIDGAEHLIPAVPAFVSELNPDGGYIAFNLLEGI